jgi:hypothetical protein
MGDYGIPDTWVPIVDKLCSNIEMYLDTLHKATGYNTSEFYCLQMKEKLGELRFYVSTEDDIISALIDHASYKTRTICQKCGSTKNVQVGGPWIAYLCEEHLPVKYRTFDKDDLEKA